MIMTTMELNAKKMEIIEMLMQVNDEKSVTDIMSYMRNKRSVTPPCRYTVEQVKEIVAMAEHDIENGSKHFVSHEELKRRVMPQ